MNSDDARRIMSQSGSPGRALSLLKLRVRREQRQAARKAGITVERLKHERFKEAVEKSFEQMQARIVPRVVKLRIKE
jgi:hypothetical protein